MFFCDELKKNWGDHCHSCTYCLSISKTLVTAPYGGAKKEFCSEECNSKYNRLFCHVRTSNNCFYCLGNHVKIMVLSWLLSFIVLRTQFWNSDFSSSELKLNCLLCAFGQIARCDTCSHEGKLGQSLQLLGEVKHFCDLKCLLHYCNQQVQVVDTGICFIVPGWKICF